MVYFVDMIGRARLPKEEKQEEGQALNSAAFEGLRAHLPFPHTGEVAVAHPAIRNLARVELGPAVVAFLAGASLALCWESSS